MSQGSSVKALQASQASKCKKLGWVHAKAATAPIRQGDRGSKATAPRSRSELAIVTINYNERPLPRRSAALLCRITLSLSLPFHHSFDPQVSLAASLRQDSRPTQRSPAVEASLAPFHFVTSPAIPVLPLPLPLRCTSNSLLHIIATLSPRCRPLTVSLSFPLLLPAC